MSQIRFTKFCASGNDFVVIDNRRHIVPKPESRFVRRICQRKFSIGADGVLLLDKINGRFRMRIFNPDGSEPEMCGNGARAFARFIYELGLAGKDISFQTKAGEVNARIYRRNVKIEMPLPGNIELDISLRIKGQLYLGHFIDSGVPHLIIIVKDIERFPVKEIGRYIRYHKRFMPRGTNVDFISFRKGNIFLRTYERGVEDETFACGTGAVASAIVGFIIGRVKKIPVRVRTKGGLLKIYFKEVNQISSKIPGFRNVYLEGDARLICQGIIEEEAYV